MATRPTPLRPIADRLRAEGLPVELVESSPGHGNLVARYKGDGAKRPLLLIAHVDVVPVEGQPWTVPPFRLTEKDGFLYGRGVNDDKGMAAVVVALADEMARTKPKLARDVIFALTSGEETGGASGAQWLAQNRKDLLDAEIALNEGGSTRLDDDGNRVVEVDLGAAEKTFQSYRLVVRGKGGHSSIPPTDSDPVLTLSRALVKIGEYRFPARVIAATREELAADAKLEKPPISDAEARVAASGQVNDDDERILSRDRLVNAHLRTTCVTTQLQGSPQDNVLPTSAEATVNCRIMPDETREQTIATLQRVVGDPAVEIAPTAEFGYGPYSPADGEIMRAHEEGRGRDVAGGSRRADDGHGRHRLEAPARHRRPFVRSQRLADDATRGHRRARRPRTRRATSGPVAARRRPLPPQSRLRARSLTAPGVDTGWRGLTRLERNARRSRHPLVSGRGEPGPSPGHSLALQPQGDLPSRARLERL